MFFEYRPSAHVRRPTIGGSAVLYNYQYSPTRLGLCGVERATIIPKSGYVVHGGLHYITSEALKSFWRTEPDCQLIAVDVMFDNVVTAAYTLRRRDPVQSPGVLHGTVGSEASACAA